MNILPTIGNVTVEIKTVEHIIKRGDVIELNGLSAYYKFLSTTSSGRRISKYFPKIYNIVNDDKHITLDIEYIKGSPASYLWCNNTWGEREWGQCINSLNTIHNVSCSTSTLLHDIVLSEYIDKVLTRRSLYPIYNTLDPEYKLWDVLVDNLDEYFSTQCNISCVHGNSSMNNIIFSTDKEIKYINMRGKLNEHITILGDPNYDWAKLATSFLGMDSIVFNLSQRSIEDGLSWISKMDNLNTMNKTDKIDNSRVIVYLALILMYGDMYMYDDSISTKIYQRITDIYEYISM